VQIPRLAALARDDSALAALALTYACRITASPHSRITARVSPVTLSFHLPY